MPDPSLTIASRIAAMPGKPGASSLVAKSPFTAAQSDAEGRARVIAELIHDADILDAEAATKINQAGEFRRTAQHLKDHPPES